MSFENPRHWRLRQPRYRLIGSVCKQCGQPIFPPRPLCPDCAGRQEVEAAPGDLATVLFHQAQWMMSEQECSATSSSV